GIAAGRELLDLRPTPTALIGFSDLIAAGMLLAAREAGLEVPGADAIAGFDGVDLPWLSGEQLTTVNQPPRDRGAVAAETALALAGGTSPGNQTLGVELVVGTTAYAPADAWALPSMALPATATVRSARYRSGATAPVAARTCTSTPAGSGTRTGRVNRTP